MLQEYGQYLTQFLLDHPNWGGLITFLIAFSESLAIIGTIIPGSVTMTAVGLLVGTGIMPLGLTILWAVLGAFLGDLIGYWLGIYYNERLRNMWPFKKHPNWLEAGERFFQKHGGKSIIIGRFFGPVRSLIPLVAGLLHMSFQRFILAAIPAATLWALAYMLPGILIGALSLHLPPGTATRFILFFFLIILLLTLVGWTFKHVFSYLRLRTDRLLQKFWTGLRRCNNCQWFVRLIENKQDPESHQQLGLVILAFICLLFFMTIFISIKYQHMFALLNQPIFELLRSLRHTQGDKFMVAFTLLGSAQVLFPSGAMILIWLMWQKNWRAAIHWFIILLLALCIPVIMKHLIFSPRPVGLLHGPTTNSFPSGHTFLSVMYFGFLASLFASHIKIGSRTLPYSIASFIVILVGLSRLYLGAHWFTDVAGSLSLGLFCILILVISYRRNLTQNISLKWLVGVVTLVTLFCFILFSMPQFHKTIVNYTPVWPETIIPFNEWWDHGNKTIPMYRKNRFGKDAEPINIQWFGQTKQIEVALIKQGWKKYPMKHNLGYILDKVSTNKKANPAALFGFYFNNNLPITIFTKSTTHNHGILLLRLWQSNVNFLDNNQSPLLLGILASYGHNPHSHKKVHISYSHVIDELIPDLKNFQWKEKEIFPPQKVHIKHIKWDGKILQIKSPAWE